jgi:hypothetical protein
MKLAPIVITLLAHAFSLLACVVMAQDAERTPQATSVADDALGDSAPAHGEAAAPNRRWRVEVAPPADFYPQYIADSIRAQSALLVAMVDDTEIPESGDGRFILRLGGRFAMVRVHPTDKPDVGCQLDFEGGFSGHFDTDHSLDNIGWDGFFGLQLSWKPTEELGFRFGTLHDSAHVGDEYAERTGRQRIGYTREELNLGVSWAVNPWWRLYAEGGYGYTIKEFQEPLRAQAGVEYLGVRTFFGGRLSWYTAFDLRAYEENDWDVRTTAQLGLILPFKRGTGRYRFALEYSDGRSALGEFFFRDESYLAFGWYFDF